jgi:hypothetical protein
VADGPTLLTAPTNAQADGARIRSAATVTLLNVSSASPAVLLRESDPVEGVIRRGTAMGDLRLDRDANASGERIPLLRSRAKRRPFSESAKDEPGRNVSATVGAACGAAITTAIDSAGVSVTACVFRGGHLLAALEDWRDDCAPAAT